MSSFASLMALSATRTRESQLAVEHALQERQRREVLQRKQREEREAKERELEKKLRLQMFEEEKRQEAKMERMETERRAMELARERKEEAQKNVLLYGAKKAAKMVANGGSSPKYPMSPAAREAAKRHTGGNSDEEPGLALTREELRQRKKDVDLRKQFAKVTSKKHTPSGHRRDGQLPGGAVNVVVNANGESVTPVSAVADLAAGKSLKERLTHGPNTLVLLQTKARDRRTVDEAQQDIRIKLGKVTSKVLSGEEARTFDDWFGSSKDKEKYPSKSSPAPRSSSSTPVPTASASSRAAITPTPFTSSQKRAASVISRPSSAKPAPSALSTSGLSAPRAIPPDRESSLQPSKRNKLPKAAAAKPSTSQQSSSFNPNNKKPKRRRSRSLSRSESPPPKRWREDEASNIWEMVTGKPKSAYAMRDIDSDEDDMEADAFALETEERVSSRIALKEDMLALEEDRRHEEEKRQRKKEKQRTPTWSH